MTTPTLDQILAALKAAVATPAVPSLLIAQADVPAYVGLSRAAWFRLRAGGDTPAPLALDGAGVVFRRADIDQWVRKLRAKEGGGK